MMAEKVQIIKPIDYEGLRLEAMEHIAKLSSSFWTDYNTHDPGVAIMEILCFALTELGLRTNLPLNDIIAEFLNKQEAGFYPSHEILTNKPVTSNDYRKLLMDIDGVKKVWLSEIEGHHSPVYIDSKNEKLALMSEVETFYHLKCKRYETVPDLASVKKEEKEELEKFLNLKFNNSYVLLTRINFREIFQENSFLKEIKLYFPNQEQLLSVKIQRGELSFNQSELKCKGRFDSFYDDESFIDCQYEPIREPNEEEQAELQDLVAILKTEDLDLLNNDFWQIFDDHKLLKSLTYIFAGTHERNDETFNNYLKVFKDVNGALCFSSHDEENLVCRGYYRVDVELEEGFPKERQEEKLAEIRSRLNQNRNLCELFPVINIVEDEFVCVCFDIEVAPDANVEDVLSEVVYRLDKFISPDVHFYSLKQMKKKTYKGEERHYVVEDIFNGPLLRNGFIDDQELAAALPKKKLYASDLIQEIMNVDKVLAVKQLTMSSFHPDNNGELYPVEEENDWELLLDVTRSTKLLVHQTVTINDKDYSSKFVAHKGNLPYHVPPRRLLDNIRVLKARDLPLPFTSEDLTEIAPTGRKLDLDYYYSIRNHFPMTYALKDGELEDSASNERKAKVMQLRAFLLFFDQLLANSFKQLSKLGQLLSFEPIDHTYFTQLSESGEALKALLSIEPEVYLAKVQECTESKYLFDLRRNRFLNHILARFAEEFHDYLPLAEKIYGDEAHQRLIKDKERVLQNIVPWSSERACAENIMISDMTPMNLSGLEYRFRIFLGMAVREFRDCSYEITPTESGHSLRFFDEDKDYLKGSSSELDSDSLKEIAKKVLLGSTIGDFKIEQIKQNDSVQWFYRTRKTYAGGFILESPVQYDSEEEAWQGLEECLEFFIIRAKYNLLLNQSNISLYEECGSNGNISYGFTITNTQGEFLKSNTFASENDRRSAIEDFLANLELLRSSMDKEKKDSIEHLLHVADHLGDSDREQVSKIIESLLSKTDILKYSKDENRIKPLRKLLFMVSELDKREVSDKDKRKFIKRLLRKNGKFAQSVEADRLEIISRIFQLHSRGGELANSIKILLARKAVYSHMDELEQDKLVSDIIKVLSDKKLTDNQKKDEVKKLLIKAEKESLNTRENHTRFVRMELPDEKHFIVEKIHTGYIWKFSLSMKLGEDVTVVLDSTKKFNSEYEAEIALYEAIDFLLDFRFIDKMFIIEHILLLLANSDPKQLLPVCTVSHGEEAAGFDPFSFRITLVLPGETELLANMEFRQYLEKSIREATPSHVFPKICWVSEEQMIAFETAYTNWRDAYLRFARHSHSAGRLERAHRDAAFSAEHLNKARAELINILNGLETIYHQAILGSSTCTYLESDKNPLVLGQAKLGTLNGE